MLAADKQVLDARLRDELQQLRVAELSNVVLRYQNILTPSTLIAGFSFTAIVELDFLPTDVSPSNDDIPHRAEPIFYIAAAAALSLSLYVTTIASTGIIFGQRLQVQATADQGSRHQALVAELDSKFLQCLVALCVAMIMVVISAIAVVWVKQAYNDGEWHGTSYTASIIVGFLFLYTVLTLLQMGWRLHTWRAPTAELNLHSARARFDDVAAPVRGVAVQEFFVGEHEQARLEVARKRAMLASGQMPSGGGGSSGAGSSSGGSSQRRPVDESTALVSKLPCMQR